jgi:hypothetical protein
MWCTSLRRIWKRSPPKGVGGARISGEGAGGSGLAGLADRVRTVDGRLEITSPPKARPW